MRYLAWIRQTAQELQSKIRPRDLNEILDLPGVRSVAAIAPEAPAFDLLSDLVTMELDARIADLTAARDALAAEAKRWSDPGRLVMLDTSVYINHPMKLDEMVLADDLDERETPLRLLVPIIVIDELDALKESKSSARHRAILTLAILDRLLTHGTGRALVRAEDFTPLADHGIPRGAVTIEIVFDPLRHVRLSINDDEIIDRAIAVQALAVRPVTLLTYDTGQSMRARAAGLRVLKLRSNSSGRANEDIVPGE